MEEKTKHIINVGNTECPIIPISSELYSEEIDERYEKDKLIGGKKHKKIEKTYNNATSNIRKVADYLWNFLGKNGINAISSYQEIMDDVNISEAIARISVSQLNYWEGYPFTWIPVPKKAGFIQNVLKDEDDYDKWDLKKQKTVLTMEQVKEKAGKITKTKFVKKAQRRKIVRHPTQ